MTNPTREQILSDHGASQSVVDELLHYNANSFTLHIDASLRAVPPNEPFVEAWRGYIEEIKREGSITPLAKYLVQLRFPIEEGISKDPKYLAATMAGAGTRGMEIATGLSWCAPNRCRMMLHSTLAGEIPVIIAEERVDFVSLVRALARRNEPSDVPASMGACVIAGYRNWHRLAHEQSAFSSASDRLDRFILLSSGDYSAVPASSLGLPPEEWTRLSLRIRLEHESIHYATRRLFGSMKNSLFDELLADGFALFAATGKVDPVWMSHFLGLEDYPAVRVGGRLQNYRGKPPLSLEAFAVLGSLVVASIEHLSAIFTASRAMLASRNDRVAHLCTLAGLTLEELAGKSIIEHVLPQFEAIKASLAMPCGEGSHTSRIGSDESEAHL